MSFTIRELESLSGIRAHTIRVWEQRYNFLKPSRTVTNIRTYSNEELKTLLSVALLNKNGYKISRIDQMDADQRHSAILHLSQEDVQRESLINEMIGHMIDLDPVAFETLLNQQIRKYDIETVITGLIFYFLDKVGILWQTNKIIPVQEHMVSNIIRQKIVCAIDALPMLQQKHPQFILFLPEDEHHEMGLLLVYYLLRKHNLHVIYLGANVPLKDLEYVIRIKSPGYLYMHLSSFPHRHNFNKYFQHLSSKMGDTRLLISGSVARPETHAGSKPGQVQVFHSFQEVMTFISTL